MKHETLKTLILAGLVASSSPLWAGDATTVTSCVVDEDSRGWRIAQHNIVVDGHIDVPYRLQDDYEDVTMATQRGDFDFPRAACGGLDAPFMSIYIPPEKAEEGKARELADELIDGVEAIVARAPDKFALATSVSDVKANFAAGRISLPMGIENGSAIEGDLANLVHFHQRGIRYITLAHSVSNDISDSSYDEARPNGGLSEFGREVVREMNRLGIMVDVSHISDKAFRDVMKVTRAPVIASHSSARHFTPGFERNMSDELIRQVAETGGVVMINFGSSFLTEEAYTWYEALREARDAYLAENDLPADGEEAEEFSDRYRERNPLPYAELEAVLDHIGHVVEVAGVAHVGLGSDFDGVGDSLPVGLKDVSDYPNLVDGLLERGYAEEDIAAILGGNALRVWAEVERIAAEM